MRILHLLTQTELTGSEVYAQKLVEAQVRLGHQVWVVSDHFHVQFQAHLLTRPVSEKNFFRRWLLIFEIIELIFKSQIDVLHAHSRGAIRLAFWASRLTGRFLVTTLHGRQHMSWSKRQFDTYGDLVIAICENLKIDLVERFKMRPDRIWVLPNPIGVPHHQKSSVQATSDSPSGGTESFQTPKPIRSLALIGRSSGPKGEHLRQIFLACGPELLHRFEGLKITLISGPFQNFSVVEKQKLLELLEKWPGRIHYEENRKRLTEELASFDLVVAGGRIAAETVLAGSAAVVVGEWSWLGPLHPKTWLLCLHSNFGDIGAHELHRPFSLERVQRELTERIEDGQNCAPNEMRESIRRHFDVEHVAKEVDDLYRFKDLPDFWIPTLMYHKIPDSNLQSKHRIFVEKARFESHLQWLSKQGFESVTFKDLKTQKPLPRKPVILTFDDGYRDSLTNAGPLLERYGFRGVLYLLSDSSIRSNTWDTSRDASEANAELLSPAERLLAARYFEIGSHGRAHPDFNHLNSEQILWELTESKLSLEKEFEQEVLSFCYPYGRKPEGCEALVKQARYSFAVGTDSGGHTFQDNPYHIFRANVFPEDDSWALRKKTSRYYRNYFYVKRGH